MNGPAARRYRFADLTLDLGQRRVRRAGDPIPLSKLSFELLRVLVESAPNLVQHEQLASRVWGPRRVVTPENLAKRVMLLRQALDDRAADSRYVEGVRGQGYRLIPDVRLEADPLPPSVPEPAPVPVPVPVPVLGGSATPAPERPAHDALGSAGESPAPQPDSLRRRLLVGGLAAAFGALAVDDLRLRWTQRTSAARSSGEPPRSFALYAPRSSSFGASPTDPQPALAPGGRELAFVAPLQSTGVIWVQPLDNLDARPLIGTDQAFWPFWSADARYIAYFARGGIARVAAAGGATPTEVAKCDGAFWGGAWADDDTLLFGGPAGLRRVAASVGDEPVPWTELDARAGEFSHRFPVLLPGGRRFVYLALSTHADREGFYIGSLDDRGMKRWLRPGHSKAAVAFGVDGRLNLLFVGEHGELLAQAFDASQTTLTGDAVEVARPYTVEINRGVCAGALAAADRTLVYRPRVAARTRLVWRDRTGAHGEVIPLPDGAYRHLALSHDGTMLTVERDALDDASGLWLIDRRRNQDRRLGSGQMSAWTHDDRRVVYSDVRPQGWRVDVRTIAADAAAEPLLTGGHPFVKRICDVTRHGVLFQCEIAGNAWLYYWSFTAREPPRTLPVAAQRPSHARVSPDGRWLAYSATDAGETHVYVARFPNLGDAIRISTFQGTDPKWRSDGSELYYVTLDRTLMAVGVKMGDTLGFGAPVALFHVPLDPRSLELSSAYAPAPDGQRFVVAELVDQEEPRLDVRLSWERAGRPGPG